MTVSVDPRVGGREPDIKLAHLLHLLQARCLPTKVEQLGFGDFCFEGNGPSGRCMVGIEHKRVRGMMGDIRTGRFSGHQLLGLVQSYDVAYLVVEGIVRSNPESGVLEEGVKGGWRTLELGSQAFMFRELDAFLTTLELCTPIRVRRTGTTEDTVACLQNLYRWFNDKEWDKHRAHLQLYTAPPPVALLVKPSLVRLVANTLPGVGWERSAAVAAKFGNVVELVAATEKEWQTIPGVGKVLAKRIVSALDGQ